MPPPPPPGPPPPPFMAAKAPSGGGGGAGGPPRDMLLNSIRQGAKLKKTVTVDKSGPFIAGKVGQPGSGAVDSSREGSREGNSVRVNGGPPALGGLFAGGMPKLKATGLGIGKQAATGSPGREGPVRPPNPPESRAVNRGPPPQPPPASHKPNFPSSASESATSSPSNNGYPTRPLLPSKPPAGGHGKPNLAPRPPPPAAPTAPSQDNKPMLNGRPTVSRTRSMCVPRSPPVAPPNANGPLVSHLSQEGLNMSKTGTLPHSFHHGKTAPSPPGPGYRGTPTRPPGTRPPPPPSRPAPPTTAPPPPPPHRTSPAPPPPRLPPAAPHLAPPAPPARNSSMRNGNPSSLMTELEARLAFHNVREFPEPEPFRNVAKNYNTRIAVNAKQQAPAPPQPATHLQLSQKMWSNHASQC